MNPEFQSLAVYGLGIFCTILGWLARELWGAVKALRADLSALEVRITRDYVSYDRLADAMRPLLEGINDIKERLSHKVDKP